MSHSAPLANSAPLAVDGGGGEALLDYDALCARTAEQTCWPNDILELTHFSSEISTREVLLTFPVWFSPLSFKRVVFPFFAGGMETDENYTLTSMKVLSLNYFLKSATKEERDM